MSSIGYRPDVDGLRAVAILPVLAFHLGLTSLAPGGFIGVDVFFVISGYLIAGILLKDVHNRRFSIADFYARRVRRIFPALMTVFTACMAASLVLSFPMESREVGHSILASLGFSSNILFFLTADYFSSAMERNPLLHTWSLSVEEQFYVFFPLLVVALRRVSQRVRLSVFAALAVLSFGISCWQVTAQPEAAFYLLPARAWELLVGAFVAAAGVRPWRRGWAEAAGLAGMAAIGLSVLLLTDKTPFPGPAALGACVGAALLIASGQSRSGMTLVAHVLAWAPVRFIGLISYSLYLWHWPVIVYVKQVHGMDGKMTQLAVLAACFALATASWWFVERPFRTKTPALSRNQTLGVGAFAMVVMAAAALALAPLHQKIRPVNDEITNLLKLEGYASAPVMRDGVCFLTSMFRDFNQYDQATCLKRDDTKPTYLLLGDSHAAHLWFGLQKNNPDINILQATASGCKPVLGTQGDERCTKLVGFILNEYLPKHKVDGVILSARWTAIERDAVVKTVAYLRPFAGEVIVSGPIKEYQLSLARIMALGVSDGADLRTFIQPYEVARVRETDRLFRQIAWPEGSRYFSAYDAVETPECSPYAAPHMPVQFDYGHLTGEGSVCVTKQMPLLKERVN